jgi:hypothetical protein
MISIRLFTELFINLLITPKHAQVGNFSELYIYREDIFYVWLCLTVIKVEKEKPVSLLFLINRDL